MHMKHFEHYKCCRHVNYDDRYRTMVEQSGIEIHCSAEDPLCSSPDDSCFDSNSYRLWDKNVY